MGTTPLEHGPCVSCAGLKGWLDMLNEPLQPHHMPPRPSRQATPAQIIILGFLGIILAGALLLMLPVSSRMGVVTPFSDALLTATSATCVTGLVVHDTATYWSPFGHLVLLALIQTGGMGVVTVAVSVVMFSGRKIGLRQRWVMQESISAPQVGGIVRMTSFILKAMLLIEGTGALLLSLRFCPQFGLLQGLWYGIFHSVSAFCNAGFDLMGTSAPFSSLTSFLGRLKEQDHSAAPGLLQGREDACAQEKGRGMDIMSAAVAHSGML